MKKIVLLPVLVLIALHAFSQIDLKGGLNKAKQDAIAKAKGAVDNKMDASRKEFDESNFNYAISFSDNAGLFETKEKGDRFKNSMVEGYKVVKEEADPIDRAK
nr:hypothetical protein [Bacteroidota bacterium]